MAAIPPRSGDYEAGGYSVGQYWPLVGGLALGTGILAYLFLGEGDEDPDIKNSLGFGFGSERECREFEWEEHKRQDLGRGNNKKSTSETCLSDEETEDLERIEPGKKNSGIRKEDRFDYDNETERKNNGKINGHSYDCEEKRKEPMSIELGSKINGRRNRDNSDSDCGVRIDSKKRKWPID